MSSNKSTKNKQSLISGSKKYIFYTGLGFQMIAIIGVFTFIGYKIDGGGEKRIFTAIFALLGVLISLISTIRSVTNRK